MMASVGGVLLMSAVVTVMVGPGDADFNLYLTQAEVRRILGLTAELFYVREGVVNDYAMNWRVPVPADVHRLYFTWVALEKKTVLYNMAIWMNETEVAGAPLPLAMPSVNVSLTGTVPSVPATFRLDLPCTGLASAEVDVIFNINFTSPRSRQPPTILYFKRRKICFEGQSAEMYAPHLGPLGERGDTLPVVYYVVPALAGLTLVVTIIVIVAYIRRKRIKRDRDPRILGINDLGVKTRPMTNSTLLRAATPNNNTYTLPSSVTINSYASLRKLTTPITPLTPAHVSTTASLTPCSRESGSREVCDVSRDSGSRDTCQSSSSLSRSEVIVDPSAAELQERFRQMEVERQRVRLTAVAHEGSFGRVFRGWIQRDRPEQDQQVLIKTVTEGAPHDEVVALYREGTHLFNLYHRNVLTMVGISFADNSSPFLIYPFHGYNNLKQYLQEHRGGHLRAAELVELAVQAAHGLSFLHTANVLHGDLAARNCVVSEKLQLRITDAALSRDLFPSDYEAVGSELARPIKWMSYEAITDRLISTASDVWSYGVLLWELTTLAQQPYVEVATCEMGEYLRDGYRLAQPLNCPDDLYKVMAFCWAIHPHDRPHAKLILDYLAAFHQQLNSFI
ncbi:tyrosine-protein kinase Dnt [Procambarus clarkii]|uniref:tyrosine-protein kinase Dnt n=1 Tax=Procambarus clarkii TaxID=6728 RepID=UPI001E6778AF|nr:tyrosine-protein kinase Dnt-like [Procambarus clarkii]